MKNPPFLGGPNLLVNQIVRCYITMDSESVNMENRTSRKKDQHCWRTGDHQV